MDNRKRKERALADVRRKEAFAERQALKAATSSGEKDGKSQIRAMDNLLESLKNGSSRNHSSSARRAIPRKPLPIISKVESSAESVPKGVEDEEVLCNIVVK